MMITLQYMAEIMQKITLGDKQVSIKLMCTEAIPCLPMQADHVGCYSVFFEAS